MEILVPKVSAFDVEVAVENSLHMQHQSKQKSYFISTVKLHVSAVHTSHHQTLYKNSM